MITVLNIIIYNYAINTIEMAQFFEYNESRYDAANTHGTSERKT